MKVRTAPLAAVLATALLITTALGAAAVEPVSPEAPVTNECSTTALGPAEHGEAQELGEAQEHGAPELTGITPEPVPTTDPEACEDACISAWGACLNACDGNPECRNDCHYDKQLCMNDCWTGCHWLNEGC